MRALLLFLALLPVAHGAIALVNSQVTSGCIVTSASSSKSCTLGFTPTTGNTLWVAVALGVNVDSGTPTLVDNNSNSFTIRAKNVTEEGFIWFSYTVPATAPTSVTFTRSSGTSIIYVMLLEYSGVGSIDSVSTLANRSAAQGPPYTCTSLTPTQAGETILAGTFVNANGTAGLTGIAATNPATFTIRASCDQCATNTRFAGLADALNTTSSATGTITWTFSNAPWGSGFGAAGCAVVAMIPAVTAVRHRVIGGQ